jgi:4-carboxymuconolactone decarboxylase
MNEETRYERGLKKLHEVDGRDANEIVESLGALGEYVAGFAYGDIYCREGISLRDRSIATVAMLTVLGSREPQLKVHLKSAINVGLSPDEIQEVIIHTVPYAGFPTAINAMNLLKEVLEEKENE